LNGEREVSVTSLTNAERLFIESMATLEGDEGWKYMKRGVDERVATTHHRLLHGGKDRTYDSLKEMMDVAMFSERDWDVMVETGLLNPGGNKFKGKWSGWVELIKAEGVALSS